MKEKLKSIIKLGDFWLLVLTIILLGVFRATKDVWGIVLAIIFCIRIPYVIYKEFK